MTKRDKLQRVVNKEFKAWVKEIEKDFDDACHDKISSHDRIDREMILAYIRRWMVWELSEIYKDPKTMEIWFSLIYTQLHAGHLCSEKFEKIMSKAMKELDPWGEQEESTS